MIIAERLYGLVLRSHLTLRELEDWTDIPKSTIDDLLHARHQPLLGEVLRMVDVLELRSIEEVIAPLGTSLLRREEIGSDVVP
jgi:hypothetical protein